MHTLFAQKSCIGYAYFDLCPAYIFISRDGDDFFLGFSVKKPGKTMILSMEHGFFAVMNLKKFTGFFVFWLAAAAIACGQGWTTTGVGSQGVSGYSTAVSGSSFLVVASGSNIGGTADGFEFVYQPLSGDGQIVARVTAVPTVSGSSKAGLMIRESLNANARNATLVMTRDSGIMFQVRKTTGGSSAANVTLAGRVAPQWLKLIRTGTNFSTYASTDGVTWGWVGSDNITMGSAVYAGLAVTSHSNTVSGTAAFDGVYFSPGTVSDVSAPEAPLLVGGVRSSTSVALGWSAVKDDVGVRSYTLFRNGVAVATLPGSTISYVDRGLSPSTSYTYTLKASDASGKISEESNALNISTDGEGTGALSASLDIGAVGLAGSDSLSSGTWTFKGAGANIGGTSDAFRFGYQQCAGDTVLVARVASIQNVNSGSKAGLMIRSSLDANAPEASVLVTYSAGVVFQSRKASGADTSTSSTYAYASLSKRRTPQWVKLIRHGDDFSGYVSVDGVNWEYVGGDTIAMSSSAYAGIGVSSRSTSSLCSAAFTNLDISSFSDSGIPTAPTEVSVYSLSDVSVSLSWKPANDDSAVDSYRVFQDGNYVGTTYFARFTDTFLNPETTHNYTIQAVDVAGNQSDKSKSCSAALALATLPAPWWHDDIGSVDWAGTATLNEGMFRISGAGLNIGSTQDSFHYVYQPLNGDETIVARVASIPNPPNTSVKAGVMIRESLDDGARNAMLLVLGGSGANLQWRTATDGTSRSVTVDKTAKAPYWIKLVRGGTYFAGYRSVDGMNWTLSGSCNIPMASSAYIGLAVTSHDPRVLASAVFDSVLITTDSDNNELADGWELTWFKKIGIDPNSLAARNDGLTNLQAFQQGLNPLDYYNAVAPAVTKMGGDSQNGAINTLLNLPLTVRVTSGGVPLVNAPVKISVTSGGGLVSEGSGFTGAASSVFHSDTDGRISVYYQEGCNWGISSQIKLTAGKTSTTFAATASPQIGRWSFNSHAGITVPDDSKSGNTGSLWGGVTWDKGFDGAAAIVLDGQTGYLEVNPSATMALGFGPISTTGWMRIPQNISLDNEAAIYPLISLGDGVTDGLSIRVRGGAHALEAVLNTSLGTVSVLGNVEANAIADGFWHQIGFVNDGNGSSSLLFDGHIVGSGFGAVLAPVTSPRLWIGRDATGRYFSGGIDEIELRRDALTATDVLARYNVDGKKDGMADAWEWKYFGTLSVTGTADSDGDGISNLDEYKNGTSPKDYFNGVAPVLTKVSGDNQNGIPGLFLPQALSVKVSDANGNPLANAPVTFTVQAGGGLIAVSSTATQSGTVALRTGTDGLATVYYKAGSQLDVESKIQITAGASTCVFTETASAATLPDPWKQGDVGTVKWAGSGSLESGTFTLSGAGADITGTQDSFHYVYQPFSGDMTVVARVAAIPNPPNTSVKAGVMIRETLDSNSRNAMMLVLGGSGAKLQYRSTAGGSTSSVVANAGAKTPYWIKLVRSGTRIAGFHSADGITWKLCSTSTVSMTSQGFIGLAISSHDANKVARAFFDSVQISTDADGNGLPDGWELTWFKTVGVDPNALAGRNDGLTILQTFQQGLNPNDYYNGVAPKIAKVSGDNQNGLPKMALPVPLSARITTASGAPLANAPVSVTVQQGSGVVLGSDAAGVTSLLLHSDSNGQVSFTFQGGNWGDIAKIKVVAGKSSTTFSATTSPQVGYWTFNSHKNGIAPDNSNTGNPATLTVGGKWIKGFDGKGAVSLDGIKGHLETPASSTMQLGSGPISITAWIQLAQTASLRKLDAVYPIVTLGDGANDGLSLSIRGGGQGLEAAILTGSGVLAINGNIDTAIIGDGRWHHVAFVCDENGNAFVAFDGKSLAAKSGIQFATIDTPKLWIGRDGANHFFKGGIDDVELRRNALSESDVLANYNIDTTKSGLPDWWKWEHCSTLKVDPNSDQDGDGITNADEYKNGTDPSDYYNGAYPLLTIVSGNDQNGSPKCFLAKSLTVLVSTPSGTPLANAPVTFSVQSGGGRLALASSTTATLSKISVCTGTNGCASVYYMGGSAFNTSSTILAYVGSTSCIFTATTSPLVAQWNFDEGNGPSAADSSKTGNACSLAEGVKWISNNDGKGSVSLDGKTGYLFTVPSPTLAISATTALSASGWFRVPQDLPLDDASCIYPVITLGDETTDNLSLVIRGGGHGVQAVFVSGTSRIAVDAPVSPDVLHDGNWHHLYFAYDGYGNVIISIDDAIPGTQGGVQMPKVDSPRAQLGRDVSGNYFMGDIDNVEIRRDSLAQLEFQKSYSNLFGSFQNIDGSNFIGSSGLWNIHGKTVEEVDRRGWLDYSFTIPTSGVWGFQLVAKAVGAKDGITTAIPLDIFVDGVLLGSYILHSFDGSTDTIMGLTQNLLSGTHTIRVVNRNASGRYNLQINSLSILKPKAKAENDASLDWVKESNVVLPTPEVSYTSPICVEGEARFAELASITISGSAYKVQSGINGQWYANLPLKGDGTDTSFVTTFENGLVSSTSTVRWSALNISEHNDTSMVIRRGDSLRLTAFSGGVPTSGTVNISVTSGTEVLAADTVIDNSPLTCKFEQNGAYTVQATWSGTSVATMTILVKDASFGDPIVAYVNNSFVWQLPSVQSDLFLEWDKNISATENSVPGIVGRSFTILPVSYGTKYVVARLSPGGPIVAQGIVNTVAAYSASTTGDTGVVTKYENGDRLVKSTIVIDGLPQGGYAEVRIFVAGVTFTDGTTVKRLYASDFDSHGMATLLFNYPSSVTKSVGHSVCHHVYIFDANGNQVGVLP